MTQTSSHGVCIAKDVDNDGFIAVKKDKDGEKDLIPISEVIAKATRDAFNTK